MPYFKHRPNCAFISIYRSESTTDGHRPTSTFKRPHDLASSSFETTLDRLEAFWESEVARAGEPEAKGWAAWETAGCPDVDAGPSRPVPTRSAGHDPYSRWATDELVLDKSLILPCRSFDEETSSTLR